MSSTRAPVTPGTGRPAGNSAEWVTLAQGAPRPRRRPPSVGRVVGRFVAANLVAVLLLLVGSVWASREAALDEAVADARSRTDVIAELLVEPHLRDGLLRRDDQGRLERDGAGDLVQDEGALREIASALDHDALRAVGVVRVKIWSADGTIVYSDDRRLLGAFYPLGAEEAEALEDGVTRTELSELSRPENRYESSAGRLLEVYRVVRTDRGQPLLLETYSPYLEATARQRDIWFRFAPISIVVLLIVLAMQLPLAGRMVAQLRATQRERELLQEHALDASTEERRRIAGSLHDGVVQDVSASSLLVAGAADKLADDAPPAVRNQVSATLGEAAAALRQSVAALRSLLVEIHPPDLARVDLPLALADLTARLRPRGIDVRVDAADDLTLPPELAVVVFRTARETLRNVVKHSGAGTVELRLRRLPDRVLLEIEDDGAGFDVAATLERPRSGHVGLSLLGDLAASAGGTLRLRSAPGAGTALSLELPLP